VNPCSLNPCMNGGTCVQNGLNYSCACQTFATGSNCQIFNYAFTPTTTTTTTTVSLRQTAYFGTNSGTTFYNMGSPYPISKINIRSGAWLDSIQLQYSNGYTPAANGGTGGSASSFSIPSGQYIISVYVCAGGYVDKLVFTTSLGTIYSYGNIESSCTTVSMPTGLLGIGGYSDGYLRSIYFIY